MKFFFCICSPFLSGFLLLSPANLYGSYPTLKAALQADTQLSIQRNTIFAKDAAHFIENNGELISLTDLQQLVTRTLEIFTATLRDLDLPDAHSQCLQDIEILHRLIHQTYSQKIHHLAIRGSFQLISEQILKFTSPISIEQCHALKPDIANFLQNPSKNTHDLASKFLVLKLTREVKFLETITSLIFDSQFKQSDLILLICRLFHTGLAILDSMKNQSDKDVQASYQKISNQLDAIRAAMSHPLTLIDSQLPSSCNPSNQEWIQLMEQLGPTDTEIPGPLRRKMTAFMPLLRNDYEEGLQHLLKVGLLSSNPLSDNLAADPLGTPLAQKNGPRDVTSNHHQSLDPIRLGIGSQRRQSKELTSNGGPSQPLSKRARSDSRTNMISKNAAVTLAHRTASSAFSLSSLGPALNDQRLQSLDQKVRTLDYNTAATSEEKFPRMERVYALNNTDNNQKPCKSPSATQTQFPSLLAFTSLEDPPRLTHTQTNLLNKPTKVFI